MANEFDVFLSHNNEDKPLVESIAAHLKSKGLSVWLDKDELRPGLPWQKALEEAIGVSRAVAIFIGPNLLKSGQEGERIAFIDRSTKEGIPVIPVLLPGCPDSPKVTELLEAFTWIDLRKGVTDKGLALLIWGITGNRPAEIASGSPRPGRLAAGGPPGTGLNSRKRKGSSKDRPRWEAWGFGIGIAGVLVAIGAWLWPFPWGPRKPELYEVRVQILDPSGHPVSGASLRTSTGNEPHLLPDGWWEVQIPRAKVPEDGKVTIWAEHDDWESHHADLVLGEDRNVQATIRLKPPQTWIRGRVIDGDNRALAGVTITPDDGTPGAATSGADGRFALQLPVPRERKIGLRAELEGWKPDTTYCYAGRDGCHLVLTKP